MCSHIGSLGYSPEFLVEGWREELWRKSRSFSLVYLQSNIQPLHIMSGNVSVDSQTNQCAVFTSLVEATLQFNFKASGEHTGAEWIRHKTHQLLKVF